MVKRALVIGSQIPNLRGVEHDVRRVRAALADRGFAVDVRTGGDASRAGILDGYRALIGASGQGDAAVVYYSGHGGRAVDDDPRAGSLEHAGLARALPFIVPTDYEPTADDDFRGIGAWELSLLLLDLTERTRNVTVAFDCCHSAQMSRDAAVRDAIPRALPHPRRLGITAYRDALRAAGWRLDRLAAAGNPHAVRLFACAETQSAWEYPNADGHPGGAFTEALLTALAAVGDAPVSWSVLGRALRERVLRRFPSQRPELGGPLGRAPFELHEPARSEAVPVVALPDRTVIRAGAIVGVGPGDTYAVMPLGATGDDPITRIAMATVTAVRPLEADVELGPVTADDGVVPAGALAFPVRRALARLAVRIEGSGPRLAELRAAIAEAPRLAVAAAGDAEAAPLVVQVAETSVRIADRVGDLVGPLPLAGTGARETLVEVVEFLGDLAVARAVRELEGEHGVSADALRVTWGTVKDGHPSEQPDHGALVGLGDRIYVRIENRGPDALHVHVFNVGTQGKVTRLTDFATLGVPVPAKLGYTLGAVDGVGLTGHGLVWPKGLPRDTPRRDEIVVIATIQPVDLAALETDHRLVRGARGEAGLRGLIEQVRRGGLRSAAPPGPSDGFVVVRRSFELAPTPGRIASDAHAFLVDDNPGASRAGLSPRAWLPARAAPATRGAATSAATRLTIRLASLVVAPGERAGAGIRVDSLACTRAAGAPPYVVTTRRARVATGGVDVGDGVLFHGAVGDFVELAVWVSPDLDGAPDLDELLAATGSAELHQAMRTLDHAAAVTVPWIGAVGATAVLTRAVHDVLARACGASVGLYRTSFLAGERFGAGRHPAAGLRRAGDLAFAIEIARDEPAHDAPARRPAAQSSTNPENQA
jgi:hypothetical protein